MQIEIDIPRPFLTLSVIALVIWFSYDVTTGRALPAMLIPGAQKQATTAQADPAGRTPPTDAYAALITTRAVGGSRVSPEEEKLREAADKVERGRIEQDVLAKKADILRGQLRILEAERRIAGDKPDPILDAELANATRILTSLLQDQQRAESFMRAALEQMWQAQDTAIAAAQPAEGESGNERTALLWPINPRLGISAAFHDPAYQATFGFPHDALDLPILQGSPVHAAADGVVEDMQDHGLGFSYLVIRHRGGLSTLYGHLSSFAVQKGEHVTAGEVIGLSGGRPGTAGAGLSTGPHLHFGVFVRGKAADPLTYLPPIPYKDAGQTVE